MTNPSMMSSDQFPLPKDIMNKPYDEAVKLLKDCGFVCALSTDHKSIENLISDYHDRNFYDHGKFRNAKYSKKERDQLWIHPAGILLPIEFRSTLSVSDDLIVSSAALTAVITKPLGVESPPKGVFTLTNSHAQEYWVVKTKTTNFDFPVFETDFWPMILAAKKEKYLLKASNWNIISLDSYHLLDGSNTVKNWIKKSVDWSTIWPARKNFYNPGVLSKVAARFLMKNEKLLDDTYENNIRSCPTEIKNAVDNFFIQAKKELPRNFLSLSKSQLRENRIGYNANKIARSAREILNDTVKITGFLNQDQSDIVEQWISCLADPTAASMVKWKALPLHLPGIPTFTLLDLALRHTYMNRAWEKIHASIKSMPTCKIKDLVCGQDGIASLSLSIVEALLNIPSIGNLDTEQKKEAAWAIQILDLLALKIGKDQLVWENQAQNVWGAALARHINIPADEDLIVIHANRMSRFVNWASEKKIDLPKTIKWTSPSDNSVQMCELNDLPGFCEKWKDHGQRLPSEMPETRWNILSPARSLIYYQVLGSYVNHKFYERKKSTSKM